MRFPVTVLLAGAVHDLHVEARDDARVEDLYRALARFLTLDGPVSVSVADVPLDPGDPLGDSGVRAGAVLRVLSAGEAPGPSTVVRAPRRGRELRVVAGPDAGVVVALPTAGTLTIGRADDNDIVLAGTALSRHHASLRFDATGVEVTDLGSANGTAVDGVRVAGAVTLQPGAVLQVGDDRLMVVDEPGRGQAAAVVTPQPDGTFRLTRQQRFAVPPPSSSLDAPSAPPARGRAAPAAGLSAAGGLVLGVVAYVVWHNAMFLLFSAVSTVTLVVTGVVAWTRARREHGRATRHYATSRQTYDDAVSAQLSAERTWLLDRSPDAARTLFIARRPDTQLWERRPTHDDFLMLRVGLADQPSRFVPADPAAGPEARPPVLIEMPVTIDLRAAGTIGMTGGRSPSRAAARWLVVQAAVQSGPADLSVVVLTRPGDDAAAAWDWVRWLPHSRPDTGPLARVGSDEASLTRQVDELAATVALRRAQVPTAGQTSRFAHTILVVVDDLPEHDVKGLADVLSYGPDVGVLVIAIEQLPYRCPITVTFTDTAYARVRQVGCPDLPDVLADQVSPKLCERLGRDLAPLRDPETRATGTGLPTEVALLDLAAELDPDALAVGWRRQPRQTSVVIGLTADGPLFVDPVANGPHALIAGATGWGKSALLQSLIGSLALANRPDELGFILVDFKGGAAFAAFADLPHTVGSISNLDGQQVMRALDSLAGEMERRQQHLRRAAVEKLEQYQQLADAGMLPPDCPAPLPRLFVVIDEFAMLKEQLPPDILARLVQVAVVGRSLGLHLVIGTQTPRSVVPAEIRPNINLNVALRLPADHSVDVIASPAASTLNVRGRAYLRQGEEAELTLFQSAFLGGRTRPAGEDRVRLIRSPWSRLGYAPADSGRVALSDMTILVDAVRAAANRSGLIGPAQPWLPELPAVLPLADLPADGAGRWSLAYGKEDHPERRGQPVAAWDLVDGTNLLVGGQPKSGRTTLLRTLAASAARIGADRVWLYVMDCGGGLADLAELPQCGALVDHTELERGERLLNRLDGVVRDRERRPGTTEPRIVLLVDDWDTWYETFGQVDNGRLNDQLLRIVRKGPALGLHVAVAGGSALLFGGRTRALNEAAQDRLALSGTATDYTMLGVPSALAPVRSRPGQAIRAVRPFRTVQVAVIGSDAAPAAQRAAIRDMAATVPAGRTAPWRVDGLPAGIDLAAAGALPRDGSSPSWVPLGVGGDTLRLLGADLGHDGPGIFVAGERHSGRSTALLGIGLDLLSRGVSVVVIAPLATSPLRSLSGRPGVAAVLSIRQPTVRQVQLALAAAGDDTCVVLIDDAEHLLRTDAGTILRENLVNADRKRPGMVVAAMLDELSAPPSSSFLAEVGRAGTGLLLAPRRARLTLFGNSTYVPQPYLSSDRAGRGVLIRPGTMQPVQVPAATVPDPPAVRWRKVAVLLDLADALAGDGITTTARLRGIVAGLLAAGWDGLDAETVDKALAEARAGFTGTAEELLAAVRTLS